MWLKNAFRSCSVLIPSEPQNIIWTPHLSKTIWTRFPSYFSFYTRLKTKKKHFFFFLIVQHSINFEHFYPSWTLNFLSGPPLKIYRQDLLSIENLDRDSLYISFFRIAAGKQSISFIEHFYPSWTPKYYTWITTWDPFSNEQHI